MVRRRTGNSLKNVEIIDHVAAKPRLFAIWVVGESHQARHQPFEGHRAEPIRPGTEPEPIVDQNLLPRYCG